MTDQQLISEFEIMLAGKWKYVWGAAKKGTVDCSGAFVYAYKLYGLSIYHGSNTIYRQHLSSKGKTNEIGLVPGMAVFKHKSATPSKFSDELGDFYHIGLYVGNNRVLEAKGTNYGFVEGPLWKTSNGKTTHLWSHAGLLKKITYTGGIVSMDKLATVTAQTGKFVRMRATPSHTEKKYDNVPVGSVVSIISQTEEWSKIQWGSAIGYMMTSFLVDANTNKEYTNFEETVIIKLNEILKILGG